MPKTLRQGRYYLQYQDSIIPDAGGIHMYFSDPTGGLGIAALITGISTLGLSTWMLISRKDKRPIPFSLSFLMIGVWLQFAYLKPIYPIEICLLGVEIAIQAAIGFIGFLLLKSESKPVLEALYHDDKSYAVSKMRYKKLTPLLLAGWIVGVLLFIISLLFQFYIRGII